jgi:hypothetical protein
MIPIMMHLHCNSDTSAAHLHDTVNVSQRTYDRRGARGRAHCMSTGELSHRGMFLNRASVRRHIAASKPCSEANMGIREIILEARAGDVMAGGGGAAGPAPDVRHQPRPAGDMQAEIRDNILIPCKTQLKHQNSWCSGLDSPAVCMRFRVRILNSCTFCQNVLYAHKLAYTVI